MVGLAEVVMERRRRWRRWRRGRRRRDFVS
jgi:hypothetical protein